MTDAESPAPPADTPEDAAEHTPRPPQRAAVLRFIGVFVVLVMLLLVGYRYAMNSSANVWYLFQVARHTAWTLNLIGESGQVEPLHEFSPPQWRVDLAQWRAERTGRKPAESISSGSITAWEAWQWKAWSRIRDGETINEDGPVVRFVLNQGIAAKQDALRRQIERVKAEARNTGADPTAQVDVLQKQVHDLGEQLERYKVGPARNEASRGRQFGFHVVPDCGAIPSMSIYLAAVLAFPAVWWKRAIGSIAGVVMLYLVNILRLGTLGYIGAIDTTPTRKWFNFAHEYVWQGIFIVFVVAVWMLWIEVLVRPRRS